MFIGILCIIYYFIICIHLRHWRSKFPRIWLVMGIGICLVSWCISEGILQGSILGIVTCIAGIGLIFFVCVEGLILSGMVKKPQKESCDYLIVLGAKVDRYNLTEPLRQRLDCAYAYLNAHPMTKVIVSGGQGEGECLTEGYVMGQYLQKKGICEQRIFLEECSTSTRENLMMSGTIIRSQSGKEKLEEIHVGVVTNNYHIYRACAIARQTGYGTVEAFPAATTPLMFPNYIFREFFAVIKMWTFSLK